MKSLLSSIAAAAAVPALAFGFAAAPVTFAANGASFSLVASKAFAKKGADDPAGHVRQGRGADDPAGDDRGGRGGAANSGGSSSGSGKSTNGGSANSGGSEHGGGGHK